MSEISMNLTSINQPHPRYCEFQCFTMFYEKSNTVSKSLLHDDTTSNRLFEIFKVSENAACLYQIKNLSQAHLFLKGELLEKDEEKPFNSEDDLMLEILHKNGLKETFSFIFSPRKGLEISNGKKETLVKSKGTNDEKLKCSLCGKSLYRCVTIAPCMHNFCSSCLSEYLDKNYRNAICQVCKIDIQSCGMNPLLNQLIREATQSCPELQRSEKEKEEMDQRDMFFKGAKLKRYTDGSLYFGFFNEDKREGKGKFIDSKQNYYEGEWKGDRKEGYGEHFWPDGEHYKGEVRDGKFNGLGEYLWLNGDRYKGEFKNGKLEGQGEYCYANGDKYKGEWKNCKKHGFGEFVFADGEFYKGEYCDNKREEQGECFYANGDRYAGGWVNSKKNGFGDLKKADGTKEVGQWDDGKFCGDDKKGGTLEKSENSEKIKRRGFFKRLFSWLWR